MITELRAAARTCAFTAGLYVRGDRPVTRIPADLGHALRCAHVEAWRRAWMINEEITDVLAAGCIARSNTLHDGWVRAGRSWERHLGMKPGEDAAFLYGPSALTHLLDEPCTPSCHDQEPECDHDHEEHA